MPWLIKSFILLIELLSLSMLGSFITSLLFKSFPKLHPEYGIVQATLFASLSPTCLCSSYPMLLTIKNNWIRYYTAISSSLLSPFTILFSFSLLGKTYTILRILVSITFAILSAIVLNFIHKPQSQTQIKDLSPTNISNNLLSGQPLLKTTTSLFKAALKPILLSWLIFILIQPIFSSDKVAKLVLYPNTQILSLPIAMLTKFCFGQEIVLLKALSGLPIKMGFKLAFSLASTGFCISSLPIYLRIFSSKGTFIYALLALSISIFLTIL